jgi:adenylate kinase
MTHLVFIGAPGAGKGTVAKQLPEYLQLSTGDMLRAEVGSGSELGNEIKACIDNGHFVSDEMMFSILKSNLPKDADLIFDGYPRNTAQIKFFEELVPNNEDVKVIFFNVDLDLLTDRIVNRSTCGKCGEIHHTKTNPAVDDKCNKCGGEITVRKDDNVDALVARLETFKNDTLPIVDHFKNYPSFKEINASKSPEEVLKEVKEFLSK